MNANRRAGRLWHGSTAWPLVHPDDADVARLNALSALCYRRVEGCRCPACAERIRGCSPGPVGSETCYHARQSFRDAERGLERRRLARRALVGGGLVVIGDVGYFDLPEEGVSHGG